MERLPNADAEQLEQAVYDHAHAVSNGFRYVQKVDCVLLMAMPMDLGLKLQAVG